MTEKYITLGSNNLDRSYRYYDPVMEALGAKVLAEYKGSTKCYQFEDGFCVWVGKTQNGETAAPGNGHTAGFAVETTQIVDAAYKAALENGGSDEGAPGPRTLYGPDFYGASTREPDRK